MFIISCIFPVDVIWRFMSHVVETKCVWDCLHKCIYGLSQIRSAGSVPSQLGQLEISLCMQKRRLHCDISSHHYLWVEISCLLVSCHVLLCLKACRCTIFAAPKYAITLLQYSTQMPRINSPFCRIHSATIFSWFCPLYMNYSLTCEKYFEVNACRGSLIKRNYHCILSAI